MSRGRRGVIVVAVAAVALLATGPAAAQTRRTTSTTATGSTTTTTAAERIRLASQTPWVGRGGELALRLLVATDRARDLEIAVTVYPRVATRSDFERTLRDIVRGSPITLAAAPLTDLTADAGGAVTVRLPVQDPSLPRAAGNVVLTREGVYPVRVELRERGGGTVVSKFTTHLVYVPGQLEGSKLAFAWVVPFHAPPVIRPDATRSVSSDQIAALAGVARALDAHPSVPVVLRATPETLDGLATRPDGRDVLTTLVHALPGRQVVAETYVPTNLPQLLASGLGDELATERDRGTEVLSSALHVRPDASTWVFDEHLDESSLASLQSEQIDRVVVDDRTLEPSPLPVTLAAPFTLEGHPAGRRSITALAADPGLADHFGTAPDPVLAGHQLLADLAVVHFDRPGKPRVVVGVAPRTWRADARFLDVVLSGVASSPIVTGITLEQAFDTVPDATTASNRPLVRHLDTTSARPPATLPSKSLRAARSQLLAFNSLVEPGNPVYEGLDRVLLAASSSDIRSARRTDYISGVTHALRLELARVQMPGNRSITLTARQGEIPITIRNRLGYPIKARLRLISQKLEFPQGATRELALERENTTERFAVRSRTSGAFPVRVVLDSGDGRLVLGQSLFTVRSTAASGVGVVLSVGAGIFLLLWWAAHFRRTRRSARALEPTTVDD